MTTTQPQLQKPGAGLPLGQMIFLKLVVGPFFSKRVPPQKSRQDYQVITQKILQLADSVSAEKRRIKVLVPPMAGLEDSSRYWSVDETLEHLLIVATAAQNVIASLCQNQVPTMKADVAKVKPQGQVENALEVFRNKAPFIYDELDQKWGKEIFKNKLCFRHPWFGLMKASQWYWLIAVHQGLHYKQLKAICQQLNVKAEE